MKFIKLNKSGSPTQTINGISFYKMSDETELEPTPTVVYTLASSGAHYMVGDGTTNDGNGLTADNTATEIVIASTYNGLPVAEVGDNAFKNNTTITKVVIPNTITMTGTNIFQGCTNLENVTLSENITRIDDYMFASCTNLKTIKLPNKLRYIRNFAFQTSGLTEIFIPDGVILLGDYAFKSCQNLVNISFPNSLQSVGFDTFAGTPYLTNLIENSNGIAIARDGVTRYCIGEYPDKTITSIDLSNVAVIGAYSFFECTALNNVIIPSSVFMIGGNAFKTCTALTNITFEHKEGQRLAFGSAAVLTAFNVKNSTSTTIYHYGNSYVLSYDFAGDNRPPTFVDLREV